MLQVNVGTFIPLSLFDVYAGRRNQQFFDDFMSKWHAYQKKSVGNKEVHFKDCKSLECMLMEQHMIGVIFIDEESMEFRAHSIGVLEYSSAINGYEFYELSRHIDTITLTDVERRQIHDRLSDTCRQAVLVHYYETPTVEMSVTPLALKWCGLFQSKTSEMYTYMSGHWCTLPQ